MVTLNPFVVPDEIFSKISTAAASLLPDMNGNSSSTSSKMGQDQPLAVLPNVTDQIEIESTVFPPVSGAANGRAWKNMNGHQRFSGWVASNLVPSATFKIKIVLLVALYNVPLGISSDNIKTALDMFGVVTSVKLKPADTFSVAAALTYWSVLVRKDSVRIFFVVNQNNAISSKNAFKAKLVNLLFGCTAFEISNLVSQVGSCICFISCFSESY
ncbi:hypothetical protein G9A89_013114 [Geosiphon pyriformis]|nr:hypothetical protein G9A89_013114 [Geosiphon pyriformis]